MRNQASVANTTSTEPGAVLTQDGQPFGSAAYDAAAATAHPAAIARHLSSLRAMPSVQRAWEHAYRALRLGPGCCTIDIGCGTGVFLPLLGELVGETGVVVGLDHASTLLAEAKSFYVESRAPAPAHVVAGDAHHVPFPDATFNAAHIERVLMHLDDPDRALRELARIVRPEGWVVAVEPDLAGWRIDFPDQEAMRALVRGFCLSWRHPAMGLELPRRMTTAGLVDVAAEVVTAVERDLPEDVAVYYRRALDVAVERGWIAPDRAHRTMGDLARAAETGAFTSYSSLFVVAGRVPGAALER